MPNSHHDTRCIIAPIRFPFHTFNTPLNPLTGASIRLAQQLPVQLTNCVGHAVDGTIGRGIKNRWMYSPMTGLTAL
jgi:hypothetical protein